MSRDRARDSVWVAVGFGIQLTAQFVRAIVVARLLSPRDLGLYFVLRSIAGVVAIVVPVALGQIGLRLVAAAGENANAARTAVWTTLRLTAAGSFVVLPATWLCLRIAGFGSVDGILVAAMMAGLAWTGVLADLIRGLGRIRESVVIEKIGGSVVDVAGLTLLLLVGRRSTLTMTLWMLTCTAIVPVAALAVALTRAVSDHGKLPSAASIGQPQVPGSSAAFLSQSWPVAANALFWRALAGVDLWLVAWLRGPEDVALYGVATRLAAPIELPKTMAIYLLSASIAGLYAGGRRAELERLLKTWARRALVAAVAAFGIVLLMGSPGLGLVFGEGYDRAMPLFIVVGIGQLVSVGAGMGGTTLLMTGHTRTLLKISVFSSAVGAIIAIAFIPPLGVIGAALGSCCGRGIQSLLMVRAARRYAGVSVHVGPGAF